MAKPKKDNVRVYEYCAKLDENPEATANLVRQQTFKQFCYYNDMVRVETTRREKYRALRESLCGTEYKELEQQESNLSVQIQELSTACGTYNNPETRKVYQSREENIKVNEVKEKIRQLRDSRKIVYDKKREMLDSVKKEHFTPYDEKFSTYKQEKIKQYITDNGLEPGKYEVNIEETWKLTDKLEKAKCRSSKQSKIQQYVKDNKISLDKYEISRKETWKLKDNYASHRLNSEINKEVSENTDYPEFWKLKHQYDTEAAEALICLRKDTDVYSGSYLAAEEALTSAKKKARYNPNRRHWDYTGSLEVRLNGSKGVKLSELFAAGGISSLRIVQGERLNKDLTALKVAIQLGGSGKNAARVYFSLTYPDDRRLPEDALIKRVRIVTRRIGRKTKQYVQFSFESNIAIAKQQCPTGTERVAIRLGYRRLENGDIRIATTYNGKDFEYLDLPSYLWLRKKHAESLIGFADIYFGQVINIIKELSKEDPDKFEVIKHVYMDDIARRYPNNVSSSLDSVLHLWKSKGQRLPHLIMSLVVEYCKNNEHKVAFRQWREHRDSLNIADAKKKEKQDYFCNVTEHVDGSKTYEDHYKTIMSWLASCGYTGMLQLVLYLYFYLQKYYHLTDTSRGIEKRLVRQRKDLYCKYSVSLARRYGYVSLGEWNGGSKKKDKSEDTSTKQDEATRALKQFCGVSILQNAIESIFKANFKKVDVSKENKTHYLCSCVLPEANGANEVICEKCGKVVVSENIAAHIFLKS